MHSSFSSTNAIFSYFDEINEIIEHVSEKKIEIICILFLQIHHFWDYTNFSANRNLSKQVRFQILRTKFCLQIIIQGIEQWHFKNDTDIIEMSINLRCHYS